MFYFIFLEYFQNYFYTKFISTPILFTNIIRIKYSVVLQYEK